MTQARKPGSRLLFAREFLKHPTLLGSVVPSSQFLVRRLLRQVDWPATRVLVEYGPGVGSFTAEILKRLPADAELVAVETSEEFVHYLRKAHPDPRLSVVHASAADVRRILRDRGLCHADAIISGIPFSTLPPRVRLRILTESKYALRPGGRFLVYQFTSAVRRDLERVFGSIERDLEPLNILPATIFAAMNEA